MSSDVPVVSAVIPCYNGENYIEAAIKSILAQTYGTVEIIVVDDGSTDGSLAVVQRYVDNGCVTLIRHQENRGISAARNTGVRASRGRYIGLLDQDDLWYETKIKKQVPVLDSDTDGRIGVVFSDARMTRDGAAAPARAVKVPPGIARFSSDELIASLFLQDMVAIGSALIRRDCFETVGYMDETIRSGTDDFEFLVRVATRYSFVYIAEQLLERRLHGANYTNAELMVPDALQIIDRVTATRPLLRRTAARAKSRLLYGLARFLHKDKQYARARRVYIESLENNPFNLKSLTALILCVLGRVGDVLFSVFRGS